MSLTDRGQIESKKGWSIPFISNVNAKHRMILLCLHGFAGDKDSSVIFALRESLDNEGIGVVSFDWPAHGESTAPDEALNVDNCLDDLETVVTWLSQWNVPIACFATSFGGYLATLYRNKNPEAFTDLILRSPALNMKEAFCTFLSDDDFAEMMQGRELSLGFERKINLGKSFYESLCAHDAFSQTPPHPENILILQGDADPVVNPSDTKSYAERFGVRVTWFEGTDHVYKRPGEKERIVEETRKFLLRKDTGEGTGIALFS